MELPSMLLVTFLGAAVAYGSFNLGRIVATLNNNAADDEDKDGDNNNALAIEGYNVNLGFGVVRFGADLNLTCARHRLGGNFDTVIMQMPGTPLAVMVSGPIDAPSSGRSLASESKAAA